MTCHIYGPQIAHTFMCIIQILKKRDIYNPTLILYREFALQSRRFWKILAVLLAHETLRHMWTRTVRNTDEEFADIIWSKDACLEDRALTQKMSSASIE